MVCTHAHEDHCGGLDDVIEAFDVGRLFAPYTEFDASGTFTRFEDTAADSDCYHGAGARAASSRSARACSSSSALSTTGTAT